MITGGFAEPQDQSCHDDSSPVAIGELVEPCRDRTELLETGEASFDHVAVAVDVLVEGGWATAVGSSRRRLTIWSRRSGIVATMPRRRSRWRIAQLEYALSPSTRAGVVRGRPVTARGMRMLSRTWPKAVASLTLPGVSTMDSGRPRPSTARCTLLVSPPRDRPRAWRACERPGSSSSSPSAAPFCGRRPRAGGPG